MTKQHPINPPEGLWFEWHEDSLEDPSGAYSRAIATAAAQWGADQELEACCKWVAEESPVAATELRATRRPKPLSLKEQSLALIDRIQSSREAWLVEELDVVRKALEQIDD